MDSKEAERRTKRYFYDDGLTEIVLGVILVLFGGHFIGTAIFRERSPIRGFLDVSSVLIICCAGFLVGRIIRFLKFRITYPRTGYVSYKKKELSPQRRRAAMAISAFIAAATATLLARSPSFRTWMPALNGILLGVGVYLIARRTEVARFYFLAAASVVIGFGMALAGFDDFKGLGLYYALFGAAMIVSGAVTFIVYLRRSRAPHEDVHES